MTLNTLAITSWIYRKCNWLWAFYALIVYCLFMDMVLYRKVQKIVTGSEDEVTTQTFFTAPFQGLTVKTMMLDHINHYVHFPAAVVFNQVSNFSEQFPWISPNMISILGFMVAILSAWLVSSDSLSVRQLGVLAYQIRNFLDAMDGMVHRARAHQHDNISNWGSMGYLVDATADTLGMTVLLVGCFWHLLRQKSKATPMRIRDQPTRESTIILVSLNSSKSDIVKDLTPHHPVISPFKVAFVVMCFGAQVGISGLAWDRHISNYYKLLQTDPQLSSQVILQRDVLGSSFMWIIMWLWRVSNAHAMSEMILIAILIDKMWEFLTFIQYLGFGTLLFLMFITEFHYCSVQSYLHQVVTN